MPVIATAGHVDHGKSTLVRALTGRDPDRWEEEQRRGMTIDLGFAWTTLAGMEVGFVDVPGHERFMKNMLAGIEGIDAALFVVAADEGWMPQSEEHLAVLDLMGVSRGVVALTRVDLVASDAVELAALEVADRLEGTSLAGAEVVPVAAPNGTGLERLRQSLGALLRPAPDGERPRLWVDRSFTITGSGTVVTGTLTGGSIRVGDTLEVFPTGAAVRVRGLQTHERAVNEIAPGNRAAVNLSGIERTTVTRGAMLGAPGQWSTTTRFLADLRTVRSQEHPLTARGSFHAHIGSGSHPARLSLRDGEQLTGIGAAVITLEEPVVAAAGDRIILREVGRRAVVAGGIILDPHPAAGRRHALGVEQLRRASTPNDRADALLAIRGIAAAGDLAADSDGGLAKPAMVAGDLVVSAVVASRLEAGAALVLRAFHADNPLRSGMPAPALASALRVPMVVLEAVVAASEQLTSEGPTVRRLDFTPRIEGVGLQAWELARSTLTAAGFSAPRRGELGLETEVMHALIRDGVLVAVGDDLVYLAETMDAIVAATERLEDGFSVAGFRDALGITRRHAVPLLEWMDARGITRRRGDTRSIKGRAEQNSSITDG